MKKIDWKVLITSIVIVFLVGFLGSQFTSQGVDSDWYESIRPEITPPDYVFPIAWNLIFLMIALSLYFSWTNSKKKDKIAIVFGINFILNILWSVFYFGLRSPLMAFIVIILLIVSILSMIFVTKKINKISWLLLLPYLIWVSFASVLNYLSI